MAAQRPAGQAWFRPPTMRPPAAAAPPPPPVVRPAIPTRPPPPPPPPSDQPQAPASPTPPAARPPSPPPAAAPPPPPPPSSPVTKAAITTTSTSNDVDKRSTTPASSHPHPPSPPAPEEPEIDQKSVLPLKANGSAKGKRETPAREKKKKVSDSEDLGVRIITIAGENRGALMEISSSSFKKSGEISGKAARKANDDDGDDRSPSPPQATATATFLNSNVQGVNNSIVYNSSCTHNDPGIHLSFTRNPKLIGKNNINGQKNHIIN